MRRSEEGVAPPHLTPINLVLLDHLEAILRFGLQNDQNSTGFIRYSDPLFRCSKISLSVGGGASTG